MKIFVSILMAAFLCSSLTAYSFPGEGLKIGDKANDFNLQNVDGNWVSLSDFEDVNGIIVIFTCNTCPYAKMYEDRIIALHNTYAPQGYPVIAINPNDPEIKPGDSFEAMQQRAEEKDFPFPYLFDTNQEVFPAFGAQRTPHVFLLDQDWIVRYIGAIDDNAQSQESVEEPYLADAIAALEENRDPDPNYTKAVGCTIKVKS